VPNIIGPDAHTLFKKEKAASAAFPWIYQYTKSD